MGNYDYKSTCTLQAFIPVHPDNNHVVKVDVMNTLKPAAMPGSLNKDASQMVHLMLSGRIVIINPASVCISLPELHYGPDPCGVS